MQMNLFDQKKSAYEALSVSKDFVYFYPNEQIFLNTVKYMVQKGLNEETAIKRIKQSIYELQN